MKVIVILDDRENPVVCVIAKDNKQAWKKFTKGTMFEGEPIMTDSFSFHKVNLIKK